KILPEVCRTLDPDRPYWPSSPYGGDHPNSPSEGDRHSWEVWSGFRDYVAYRDDNGRFISEFGFQSLPNLKTVNGFTRPEDRWPQSEVIEHHNKQYGGNERLYYFLSAHFKVPSTLEGFCEMTQINQGEALKVGIEHWRSRKFKTSGTLIWQLNDCWPVSSWSLVDYACRKKASYYYVKRVFAPILLVLIKDGDTIRSYVVNDGLEGFSAEFKVKGVTLKGKVLKSISQLVSVPSNTSIKLNDFKLKDLGISDGFSEIAVAELCRDGEIIAYSTCVLERPKYLKLPRARARIRLERMNREGTLFKATVTSKVFMKSAHIRLPYMEADFDDNYFDVVPGIPKVVYIRTSKKFRNRLPRVELRDATYYA
ncbi:MAG: glycoside hydrolase family 2 protein, partial [Candidatus Bathyarchaeia archaeon]